MSHPLPLPINKQTNNVCYVSDWEFEGSIIFSEMCLFSTSVWAFWVLLCISFGILKAIKPRPVTELVGVLGQWVRPESSRGQTNEKVKILGLLTWNCKWKIIKKLIFIYLFINNYIGLKHRPVYWLVSRYSGGTGWFSSGLIALGIVILLPLVLIIRHIILFTFLKCAYLNFAL